MSIARILGGLAIGSALALGACADSNRDMPQARGSRTSTGTPVLQNPLSAGVGGVGNPDRIGGPGGASAGAGAAAVPGSAGGAGTGTRNQGYGAPVR